MISRVKNGIAHHPCYWEDRTNPPNLDVADFKIFIAQRQAEIEQLSWHPRQSGCDIHDWIGEDNIFQGYMTKNELGKTTVFYIKGFFWPKKSKQQGVEIQSFRRTK